MTKFDMLDRTDKSYAPLPHGGGMLKRDKYSWSAPNDCGEFRMIDKRALHLDSRYQRDEVSTAKVVRIASEWNWLLFGALSVIERIDGSLWVFNGGHRLRASFYRDDVNLLPCMIFQADKVKVEAQAFIDGQTMVSSVSAIDRFRAAQCAEDAVACGVRELLESLNLSVVKSPRGRTQLKCIGVIQEAFRRDSQLCSGVLRACAAMHGDDTISASVFGGLFELCYRYTPRRDVLSDFSDDLACADIGVLDAVIRTYKIKTGQGGSWAAARALREYLNKGKRTRRLPAWNSDDES